MRELGSPRRDVLRRRRAEVSQQEVAKRIRRGQTFVGAVARAAHRVSVLEFLEIAKAIGFDPAAALRRGRQGGEGGGDGVDGGRLFSPHRLPPKAPSGSPSCALGLWTPRGHMISVC